MYSNQSVLNNYKETTIWNPTVFSVNIIKYSLFNNQFINRFFVNRISVISEKDSEDFSKKETIM